MYTILINPDNTVTHSVRQRIMQRSSNVDSLRILVEPEYVNKHNETFDMRDFIFVMEYKTPVSGKYVPVFIQPSEELYKGRIEYIHPFTTKMTAYAGELEVKFQFMKLDMLPDGTKVERSRLIDSSTITILSAKEWADYIPDTDLDSLVQIALTLQSRAEYVESLANSFNMTKADNLELDAENNKLYLKAQDNILSEIGLEELGDEIVDASSEGLVQVII